MCLQLCGKKKSHFLQALHLFLGLGCLLSPLFAAPFLGNTGDQSSADVSSTYIEDSFNLTDLFLNQTNNDSVVNGVSKVVYPFTIVGTLSLLVSILLLVTCIVSPTENGEPPDQMDNESNGSSLFMACTVVLIFAVFFIFTGMVEGVAYTLATYAVEGQLQIPKAAGSYLTSAFWAAHSFSKLASVFLVMKIANMQLIIGSTCIMGISGLVFLFLMPNEWALWLASILSGVGAGPMYAALLGWIGIYLNINNKISSIFTVGIAAGEIAVPFLTIYFLKSIPRLFVFTVAAMPVFLVVILFLVYYLFKYGNRN